MVDILNHITSNVIHTLLLFSHPAVSDSLSPWTAARQSFLSLTISWHLPKFMSIASVMPSSHLILWCPLLFFAQSFPESGTFPMSQLFASDDRNIGASASASVFPTSIQDWFPLRLTKFISLLSKGLSGVLSNTTVWRHQFFGAPPSLPSSAHNRTWPLGTPWPWLHGWTFLPWHWSTQK